MRTREEITMRCKSILGRPEIVSMVNTCSSPTAAFDMVMDATADYNVAKAARWLGVLRRDHPDCYFEVTHGILSHVPMDTAKEGG